MLEPLNLHKALLVAISAHLRKVGPIALHLDRDVALGVLFKQIAKAFTLSFLGSFLEVLSIDPLVSVPVHDELVPNYLG